MHASQATILEERAQRTPSALLTPDIVVFLLPKTLRRSHQLQHSPQQCSRAGFATAAPAELSLVDALQSPAGGPQGLTIWFTQSLCCQVPAGNQRLTASVLVNTKPCILSASIHEFDRRKPEAEGRRRRVSQHEPKWVSRICLDVAFGFYPLSRVCSTESAYLCSDVRSFLSKINHRGGHCDGPCKPHALRALPL